ncbi:NHL repeat-containing protein [Thioclava sp. GXIMD4215]|uniref:NHL repeat-containing protein n=1 Tax=Thioclava sp. GXIMD4215 TaxID=3131928 RepID=UPI00324FD9E5
MMNSFRTLTAAGALALAVVPAFPILGPTSAYANPVTPEKLWGDFNSPVGMAFDSTGNLFIAEWSPGRVSRIDPAGNRSIFADGLSGPSGLAIGADGTIYVASYSRDEVHRFTPEGQASLHVSGLATPAGLSIDSSGRLLIANRRTNQILALAADGSLEPVISDLRTPVGAVQPPDGGYVVSNIGGGVTILRPDGTRIEAGKAFGAPGPGVAMTSDGRVFVVDYGGTTVREILPNGSSRIVADGLRSPVGLVVAPDGMSLLTAAWGDGAVYRIPLVADEQ